MKKKDKIKNFIINEIKERIEGLENETDSIIDSNELILLALTKEQWLFIIEYFDETSQTGYHVR